MAISLVAAGQKWTATIANLVIAAANGVGTPAVTPTSVAGTGVSLSGSKVVAAAASSISINGCFTSAYDSYLIEYDLTASSADNLRGALRLSGTDASTAYDNQRVVSVNATTTTSQALNATTFNIDATGILGRHSGTIKLHQPAVAAVTTGVIVAGASAATMTTTAGSMYNAFINHRTATAYDGITITPSGGTLTGWVRVYGIA